MTIFIIIAVIVVALVVLLYFLFPGIKSTTGFDTKNPSAFIQTCMKDDLEDTVELISLQGGSVDPEGYYLYEGNKLKYLCYTNENYKLCGVQISFLKEHIESEIKTNLQNKASECFLDLQESYEKKNYNVNLVTGETIVELLPERVVATFNHKLTVTKGDSEQYETFRVVINNNLYELISIADSIVDWESNYGEAEPLWYMGLYHDLEIEKIKQTDDTKVYILTNINTKDKFQFASRSLVFPPGY